MLELAEYVSEIRSERMFDQTQVHGARREVPRLRSVLTIGDGHADSICAAVVVVRRCRRGNVGLHAAHSAHASATHAHTAHTAHTHSTHSHDCSPSKRCLVCCLTQ